MASSSVSQDDIDNDFEKNSRRSRIRTARARQINPSGCRMESNIQDQDLEIGEENSAPNYPSTSGRGGAEAGASNNKYDKLVAATDESVEHETSPKPIVRGKEKRLTNKMHHGNKGKQQRDRRKLREKRRSTGVVHLASTESTGGSTTGDDEESSDQQPSNVDRVLLETKRNTHQNESIANSYRQAQEKLGFSDSQPENNGGAMPQSNSLYPQSLLSYPPRSKRRNKSPSDLEADDENDHDSLNHSDSQTGSNLSLAGPSTVTTTVTTASTSDKASVSLNNSSTPRPTTPTGDPIEPSDNVSRVIEENKRLHSMLEEKDRRIHLLEFKVNQLMKDTRTIAEENARYQKENSTLVRALSTLTTKDGSSSSKK